MTGDEQKRGRLATVGAVIAAVLSSACCWLPLLLLGLGVSGGVMASTFASLRPWLLPLSLVLLAVGWYFTLRPAHGTACATDGDDCCAPQAELRPGRRFNLTMLVIATVMVGTFAFFPNYLGALLPSATPAVADQTVTTVLGIEGMTCAGCEVHVEKRLEEIPGVAVEDVDHATGRAVIHSTAAVPDSLLEQAVEKSGYRFTGKIR